MPRRSTRTSRNCPVVPASNAHVMNALGSLREAFPLQQRIEASPAGVRAAYARVLNHWRESASAPAADIIDPVQRAALVDLDAIVVQAEGLGCYPFSADDRGFAVYCVDRDEAVHAFCAIDALAVPRLLGHRARIESRCTSCGCVQYFEVKADGDLSEQCFDHAPLVWVQNHLTSAGEACNQRLCPNIRFICSTCAARNGTTVFTLLQALALANGFFSFQLRLSR